MSLQRMVFTDTAKTVSQEDPAAHVKITFRDRAIWLYSRHLTQTACGSVLPAASSPTLRLPGHWWDGR